MKKISKKKQRRLIQKATLIAKLHGVDLYTILNRNYSCYMHCKKGEMCCGAANQQYSFDFKDMDERLAGTWCIAWLDEKYYKA
jgi:hypothetical protein